VPIADRVAGELDRHFKASPWQADDDLVFAHPVLGTVLDASKLRKRFARALERAGVRPVRFHDLRHTFGTRMAAARAPLRSIMEWMGHRDFSTTLVYADFAPDPTAGAQFAARAFGRSGDPTAAARANGVGA
jgi:integrase